MKRWMLIGVLTIGAMGCRNELQTSLWQQVKTLSDEKTELTLQVEQLRQENTQLTEQVDTLTAIDTQTRASALAVPQTIRIGRHTGFYDKAKSGTPDTLVVYLEPLDAMQDVIKAAGSVEVELWNLGAQSSHPNLGNWQIKADELKGLWGRGLTGAYYRLTFPLDSLLKGEEKELTVRVRFTDYLTGKTLTDQRVITR
jgi:hypothetical protein